MSSNNFYCPNCSFKFSTATVFKLKKVNQTIYCKNCNELLIAQLDLRVKKYWKYRFLVGVVFSVIPAQIALFLNKSIWFSLLLGAICGINVLIVVVYFIIRTTSFRIKK